MSTINIGLVGLGKIASDQHLPALGANTHFLLSAVTQGTQQAPDGAAIFKSIEELINQTPGLQAITLCTPPQGRHALARYALERGLHVMMEKPPGQTVREVEDLVSFARQKSLALFATWHSRAASAVEPARAWLQHKDIREVRIHWKEDVRRWHPGQAWIWEAGGLGVFDPGINALSIVTALLPRNIFLTSAELQYPSNRNMPIAASLQMTDSKKIAIRAEFDWRQTGPQTWDIEVDTADGHLLVSQGGAKMVVDGAEQPLPKEAEYPNLYRHFANLVRRRAVDVDLAPFQLVADAFTLGRRRAVEEFLD
jgi:D-galactose 1-dehydrogenase